ncbi:MAG TPA: FecR family protein [Verrucomicrobiae bacterium]|nr:FecR family protein [Verrucomicrobiae bacterium]
MPRRLTYGRALHALLTAAALAVSLAPLHAQDSAKVIVQTGRVSIVKDASGYTFALMDNGEVRPGYTIKTGSDGYAKFQVADGSTFEVFPNSEVVYRKTNSVGDLVNVWLGKIKVVIQHLPGIPNPNNVTTPTALISVRGTIFDVDVEDEDGTTFVSLDEGIVDVHHLLRPSSDVHLAPGQSIRVYPNQPLRPLADRGNLLHKAYQLAQRGLYDYIYNRPGGGGGGGGNVPAATTGGAQQGDKGKPTGTGNGTNGTGTGSPPAPGTGSPPPPGGGGGGG